MPNKRVSLKGRGADIFFGGDPSPAPATTSDPVPAPALDVPTEPKMLQPRSQPVPTPAEDQPVAEAVAPATVKPAAAPKRQKPKPASNSASSNASVLARYHASTLASGNASIERIRQVVKTPGKEVTYVRLSPIEKQDLVDLVYALKRKGVRTTETEIGRIALNFLLLDYKENGEHSVLASVLAR